MDKKKKPVSHSHKDESEKKAAPRFVTQVVEIIEVENADKLDELVDEELKQTKVSEKDEKKDFEEVPSDSFEQEEIAEEKAPPEVRHTKQHDPQVEQEETETDDQEDEKEDVVDQKSEPLQEGVKQKQVVEELFSNRDTASVTEISIHKKSKKTPIALWAGIVVGVALLTGLGMLALTKGFGGNLPGTGGKPSPTPTVVATPPTPTPEPLPAKDALKVQVLNGGGVPGAATKMRKILEEAGYTVTNVGNADEYSYEETEVQVKTGKTVIQNMVEKDLAQSYTVASESTSLETSSPYDVVVVVGKK